MHVLPIDGTCFCYQRNNLAYGIYEKSRSPNTEAVPIPANLLYWRPTGELVARPPQPVEAGVDVGHLGGPVARGLGVWRRGHPEELRAGRQGGDAHVLAAVDAPQLVRVEVQVLPAVHGDGHDDDERGQGPGHHGAGHQHHQRRRHRLYLPHNRLKAVSVMESKLFCLF